MNKGYIFVDYLITDVNMCTRFEEQGYHEKQVVGQCGHRTHHKWPAR